MTLKWNANQFLASFKYSTTSQQNREKVIILMYANTS